MPPETDPLTTTALRLRLARALGWTEVRSGVWYPPGCHYPFSMPDWPNDPAAALRLVIELGKLDLRYAFLERLADRVSRWHADEPVEEALEYLLFDGDFSRLVAEAALRALETEPR